MASLSQIVLTLTNSLEQKKEVNELLLVKLVKNLIRVESKPGGPYKKDGLEDPLLNARILKLFILLEKPLPNVEDYLNKPIQINSKSIRVKFNKTIKEISVLKKNHLKFNKPSNENMPDYDFFKSFVKKLNPEIRNFAEIIGKKIIQNDIRGEITKISSIFQTSYRHQKILSSSELELLGQANFLTWIAYSIYDAIFDKDIDLSTLSTANIFARKSFETYREASIDLNIAINYLNKVDIANYWELSHCRFDQNSKEINLNSIPTEKEMERLLANRAIAHAIGPFAIAARYELDTRKLNMIEKALEYYCIARQLNDDLHDWVEDFDNGRITFVLARLMRNVKLEPGFHNKEFTLRKLKMIFYEDELDSLCLQTISYINKSISLLSKGGLIDENSLFVNSFLKPIAYSASRARQVHKSNKISLQKMGI